MSVSSPGPKQDTTAGCAPSVSSPFIVNVPFCVSPRPLRQLSLWHCIAHYAQRNLRGLTCALAVSPPSVSPFGATTGGADIKGAQRVARSSATDALEVGHGASRMVEAVC
eukprot:1419162-Pyramimonas_sp.AAC.1